MVDCNRCLSIHPLAVRFLKYKKLNVRKVENPIKLTKFMKNVSEIALTSFHLSLKARPIVLLFRPPNHGLL